MVNLQAISNHLEAHGWTKEKAGEADFNAAVLAIEAALDNNLGLLVSGTYGAGKTTLLNAILPVFGPSYRKVRLGLPSDLEMLTDSWMDMYAESLFNENVFLDDLGAESKVNNYGVLTEPVMDFICRFYELRTKKENKIARLFITTNLSNAEFDARYGGRATSRLKALCVPLRLSGDDKRKWLSVEKREWTDKF